MASLQWVNDKPVIQFVHPHDGTRRTIRPPTTEQRRAEEFVRHVEALEFSSSIDKATRIWLDGIGPRLKLKLRAAGLLPESVNPPALGEFLDGYVRDREADAKRGTVEKLEQTRDLLLNFFQVDLRIDRISPGMAADWRVYLCGRPGRKPDSKASESTVRIHVRAAKAIFNRAVKDSTLSANPFADLAGSTLRDKTKFRFVSQADLDKLLGVCDLPWRLAFGLCRLAGLRRGEMSRFLGGRGLRYAAAARRTRGWEGNNQATLPQGSDDPRSVEDAGRCLRRGGAGRGRRRESGGEQP
ncbi:MAG: phage integrase SAM-like domain-containing protein [Phycisphaerales bacterium]